MGIELPAAIAEWSGGSLALALAITAIVSLILGLGITVAATYVLVAIMAAPALIAMGLTVLQAHLFVFYFAVMEFLTPPVAIAALVAARLAGAPFFKTGIEATKVAMAGFIVPFFFILCPMIILQPQSPLSAATGLISILVILTALQIAVCNYYITGISPLERVVSVAIAVMLMAYLALESYVLFALGMAVFILLTIGQLRKRRLSSPDYGKLPET